MRNSGGKMIRGGGVLSLLSLALVLSLSGCGFHLRGALPLPEVMERTYVAGADGSELYYEMENALLNAGAVVVSSAEEASAILTLHSQRLARRVLSVDTQGRAAEYELALLVEFSLQEQSGRLLADRERISVVRDFSFDPDNVLAKDDEEAALRAEMVRFAVGQMMRQVQSVSRESAPATE